MSAANKSISDRWRGILYILISGCCWGFHGILIKYALGMGASFLQVFLFEVAFATVFFGAFARRFFNESRPSKLSHWLAIGGIGSSAIGVGYFLFLSFSLGPVAIGATLMFMYLPVVYSYSLLAGHQRFSVVKAVSITLIILGAILTTEIVSSFREPGAYEAVVAAILASMCYALVFILTPSVSTYTSAEFRSFAASGIGFLGTLVILAFMPHLWFPVTGNLWSLLWMGLLLAVVGQTLPMITLMKGLPLTGSSLGGVLAAIELPIAVISAAFLLGESLNVLKLVGVVIVLAGIVLYNLSDRERD